MRPRRDPSLGSDTSLGAQALPWQLTHRAFDEERFGRATPGRGDVWLVAEDAWRAIGDTFRADAIRRLRLPARRRRTALERPMVDGFAEGYWLDAWSREIEEEGGRLPWPRIDLRTADPMPTTARRAAELYATALELVDGSRLEEIVARADAAETKTTVSPRSLGYYLMMQAKGHGISWTDDHMCFDLQYPSTEGYAQRATPRTSSRPPRWTFNAEIDFRFIDTLY